MMITQKGKLYETYIDTMMGNPQFKQFGYDYKSFDEEQDETARTFMLVKNRRKGNKRNESKSM